MKLRWLFLGMLLATGCGDSTAPAPERIPGWLQQLIVRLENEPVANPPALIHEFRYMGETVYYLPPRCCDVRSVLFSATGEIICHPDGGISGKGDGRCPEFFAQAQYERTVWRDTRDWP